jgi:hypothetical protein
MAKVIFILILGIHGLIHLLGFAKSINPGSITQLTGTISRPMGFMWFLVAMLFIIAAAGYAFDKSFWPFPALAAVVISQVLILFSWGDARFGTIANVIILVVALPALGNFMFSRKIHKEQKELLENIQAPGNRLIIQADIQHLPQPVQTWLKASGIIDRPPVTVVRLKQLGEMKTKPEGDWIPFTAEQYFDVSNPAFIWTTRVDVMPMIYMNGRDKFDAGKGEMLIKLLSLFNVVNEANNPIINSGSMTRFLAEICWFPSAAMADYITWDAIDSTSARATLTLDQERVSGIFRFNDQGDLIAFEADRYYGGGPNAQKELWVIEMLDYAVFDGIRIPNKCSVTWKLDEGDFNWLMLEVVEYVRK